MNVLYMGRGLVTVVNHRLGPQRNYKWANRLVLYVWELHLVNTVVWLKAPDESSRLRTVT